MIVKNWIHFAHIFYLSVLRNDFKKIKELSKIFFSYSFEVQKRIIKKIPETETGKKIKMQYSSQNQNMRIYYAQFGASLEVAILKKEREVIDFLLKVVLFFPLREKRKIMKALPDTELGRAVEASLALFEETQPPH